MPIDVTLVAFNIFSIALVYLNITLRLGIERVSVGMVAALDLRPVLEVLGGSTCTHCWHHLACYGVLSIGHRKLG